MDSLEYASPELVSAAANVATKLMNPPPPSHPDTSTSSGSEGEFRLSSAGRRSADPNAIDYLVMGQDVVSQRVCQSGPAVVLGRRGLPSPELDKIPPRGVAPRLPTGHVLRV